MVALSERMLRALVGEELTARQLARAMGSDPSAVHRILKALARARLVRCRRGERGAMAWTACAGALERLRSATRAGACRAWSARGRPCRHAAAWDGLCWRHAQEG